MQSPYRVNVLSFESSPIYLDKGFLKCTVEQMNPPFLSREFAYCLHCKQLGSIPWFYAHCRLTKFRPSSNMRRVFTQKFDFFVNDIITEVDMLNDMGKGSLTIPRSHNSAKSQFRDVWFRYYTCVLVRDGSRFFVEMVSIPNQKVP